MDKPLVSAGKTPIRAQESHKDCAYAVPGKSWQMPAKPGAPSGGGMDKHLRSSHDHIRGGIRGKA